jgi:hypothetical protein
MRRFVEGLDRGESTLFPERLDDWVDEDNPVRVVDVFVDGLAYNLTRAINIVGIKPMMAAITA